MATRRDRSPAQQSQTAKTNAKARTNAKRRRDADKEHATGIPHSERWAALLSGQLTVADLDDEEIAHGRLRSADGSFVGRRPAIPSHLAQQMRSEYMRRIGDKFTQALPDLVDILVDIAKDPEAKHGDKIKAITLVTDRVMGKAVETVRVEGASAFDQMLADAVGVDRDLADDAESAG